MDPIRFDALARAACALPRRRFLRSLLSAAGGLLAVTEDQPLAASCQLAGQDCRKNLRCCPRLSCTCTDPPACASKVCLPCGRPSDRCGEPNPPECCPGLDCVDNNCRRASGCQLAGQDCRKNLHCCDRLSCTCTDPPACASRVCLPCGRASDRCGEPNTPECCSGLACVAGICERCQRAGGHCGPGIGWCCEDLICAGNKCRPRCRADDRPCGRTCCPPGHTCCGRNAWWFDARRCCPPGVRCHPNPLLFEACEGDCEWAAFGGCCSDRECGGRKCCLGICCAAGVRACDPATGKCRKACSAGEVSCSGSCCPAGQGCCGTPGVCTPLNTAENCGACGNACPAGQACESGPCRPTCPNYIRCPNSDRCCPSPSPGCCEREGVEGCYYTCPSGDALCCYLCAEHPELC